MNYRFIAGLFLILVTLGLGSLNKIIPEYDLLNAVRSFGAIAITYLFFHVFLRLIINKKISAAKARHLFIRLNNSAFYSVLVF